MSTAYQLTDDDIFDRLPIVMQITGRSQAAIYRDIRDGKFPRPVVIGPNSRAWRRSEVKAWQAERVRARDTGADAELRSVNKHIGHGRPRRHQAEQAA